MQPREINSVRDAFLDITWDLSYNTIDRISRNLALTRLDQWDITTSRNYNSAFLHQQKQVENSLLSEMDGVYTLVVYVPAVLEENLDGLDGFSQDKVRLQMNYVSPARPIDVITLVYNYYLAVYPDLEFPVEAATTVDTLVQYQDGVLIDLI